MKKIYPKLINLLIENEELEIFDENDPEMQIRGKSGKIRMDKEPLIDQFFRTLRTYRRKRLKKILDLPAGDPNVDASTLNLPDYDSDAAPVQKGQPEYQDLRAIYDFKLGNTMQDAQKIVGKPKPNFPGGGTFGFGDKPITFLVTKSGGVFMRVPGEGGFGKLEGPYANLSKHIIELYKELGGKILNESLSRGSLYRRRYYGRY